MEQALSDMRVLDLTHHIAGPYATKLLADYGADVIKVEKPGEGDSARRMGPFPGDIPHPEKSGLFLHLNTNKRSVTLNLKTASGRNILLQLVKDVDVLVESFRPGVMASYGLDYPALEKVNSKLVMASISNFGQDGPYRDFQASDLVLSGMGGSQSGAGIAERAPLKNAGTVTQYMAGEYALGGIMGAFLSSRWQGIGQYLDLSLYELLISCGDSRRPGQVRYQFGGNVETRRPMGKPAGSGPPAGSIYPCKDGYMEYFGTVNRWPQLVKMLVRPDLLTDPRYATTEARTKNIADLNELVLRWNLERTKEQIWQEASAADIVCAPLRNVADVFGDKVLRERGFWAEAEHPALGKTTIPGRPWILHESPWQLRRPAPLLGQHNGEVLGELGYSGEDLVRLRAAGVI